MLQYVSKDANDDTWYFSAYDQCWDDATLKELWEKHHIIFMPDGEDAVHPVMIVEREGERPLIVVGVEDDGTLYFKREYGQFVHGFDASWIDSLVKTLLKAKSRINGEANVISENSSNAASYTYYEIWNTTSERTRECTERCVDIETAKEHLANAHCDWSRPAGTGRIYGVTLVPTGDGSITKVQTMVYENK